MFVLRGVSAAMENPVNSYKQGVLIFFEQFIILFPSRSILYVSNGSIHFTEILNWHDYLGIIYVEDLQF